LKKELRIQYHYLQKVSKKGDVSYLTPLIYQTHRFINTDAKKACITLQGYQYLETDYNHYETFDYVDLDGFIQHFHPGSDAELIHLLGNVTDEYNDCIQKGKCPRC